MNTKHITIVGCGASKQRVPAIAAEMYTSTLFQLSKAYALHQGHPWYILSAKHGLVGPMTTIEPYDMSIKDRCNPRRRSIDLWQRKVREQLTQVIWPHQGTVSITLLAGAEYARHLRSTLKVQGCHIELLQPMKGLGIGKRLQWLSRATKPQQQQAEQLSLLGPRRGT